MSDDHTILKVLQVHFSINIIVAFYFKLKTQMKGDCGDLARQTSYDYKKRYVITGT